MPRKFAPIRILPAILIGLLLALGAEPAIAQEAPVAYPAEYADLLKKYVTSTGVRYAEWKASPEDLAKLQKIVDFYAKMPAPEGATPEALAWNLNAYNAWILQIILSKFPTKGPLKSAADFFDAKSITISGKKMSFNDLESKVIRPTFKEPRIHFALNCASTSCPPLKSEPFDGSNLDATLNELTTSFINGNAAQLSQGSKSVTLSRIFEWYADDFGGKTKVIDYINRYRTEKIPASAKIQFSEYDWSLNLSK